MDRWRLIVGFAWFGSVYINRQDSCALDLILIVFGNLESQVVAADDQDKFQSMMLFFLEKGKALDLTSL